LLRDRDSELIAQREREWAYCSERQTGGLFLKEREKEKERESEREREKERESMPPP